MGILVGDRSRKRNWRKISADTAEAVAQVLVLGPNGFSNAISAIMRALAGLRGEDTLQARATNLVIETIAFALSGTIAKANLGRRPQKSEIEALIDAFINRALVLADQGQLELNPEHLERPAEFALFRDAETNVYHSFKIFSPRDSEQNLKALFFRFLSEGLNRIRIKDIEYYDVVLSALSGPDARLETRIRAWERYRAALIQRFENEPLFGEEREGGTTIGQVYQPLRAWWDEEEEIDAISDVARQSSATSKRAIPRHIEMLDSLVQSWLDDYKTQDQTRLISGGPGSGKSTFAKWLAASLSAEPKWRVVFVPLQRLKGVGPLESRIDEYFRLQTDEPFGPDIPPLSTLGRDGHRDWLFIFDGLDELAKEGAGSETAAQEFASALAEMRGRTVEVQARFLVLGRAPSMQDARRRLGLQGSGTLYVADMLPISLESSNQTSKFVAVDPGKLREIDQRESFWCRWAVAKNLPLKVPEAMKAQALADLAKEPLLAYLLIFSGYVGDKWPEAADNRNRIYKAIFDQIWQRERSKPTRRHLNDLGPEGFNSIMQALGLAAWRGGGRTGDHATFTAVRETFMPAKLQAMAKQCGAADLDNVALLFYTRKDEEDGGRGYEFLHKSFGEYLTARGLIDAFQRWGVQALDDNSLFTPHELLRKWLGLAGPAPMTNEILNFLRNEARLRAAEMDAERPWQAARSSVKMVIPIMDLVLKEGVPAHLGADKWRVAETQQSNAEVSLMSLLDAWARAAYPSSLRHVKFEDGGWEPGPIRLDVISNNLTFVRFLNRATGYQNVFSSPIMYLAPPESMPVVYRIISRLDLTENYLVGAALVNADLEGCDFSRALVVGVSFANSNLNGSSFRMARFGFTDFRHSSLVGSDLRGANLEEANFESANVRDVRSDRAINTSRAGKGFREIFKLR